MGTYWASRCARHHPGVGTEWGAETQPLVKGPQPGSAQGKRKMRCLGGMHPRDLASGAGENPLRPPPGPTPTKIALPSQGAALAR